MSDDASDERLTHAREAAVVEEILGVLRHDVRNKLAAVRQAAQYLRRKSEGTPVWNEDPRFSRFFQLIDEQLTAADDQLGNHPALARVYARQTRTLEPISVAKTALTRLHDRVPVEIDVQPGGPVGDAQEIAVALSCLLENAIRHARAGSSIRIVGRLDAQTYNLGVSNEGVALPLEEFRKLLRGHAAAEGRRGLGLPLARRIALRNGGTLKLVPNQEGTHIALALPTASSSEAAEET